MSNLPWRLRSQAEREAIIADARQQVGLSWKALGRRYGLDEKTLRRYLDPHWAAGMREARTDGVRVAVWSLDPRVEPAELVARRAEIPPDTRSLTARLFGDPVYQRSALARRT